LEVRDHERALRRDDIDCIVNEQGNGKAVVVQLEEWNRILEELEELDDIRAYDEAKRHPSETGEMYIDREAAGKKPGH